MNWLADHPKIVQVETLRHPAQPHLLHLLLTAADGWVGTGETIGAPTAVEAYVHDVLAAPLLRCESGAPAALRIQCNRGFYGAPRGSGAVSVETAAASAVDIAAWDLAARRAGQSLSTLLGSSSREGVGVYNTCCDPDQEWGIGEEGLHRDFTRSVEDPAGLARELRAEGFASMKMFHLAPERDLGKDIDRVRDALEVEGIGVAVDLWGAFPLDEAFRVVEALDGLGLSWIEDPLAPCDIRHLKRLAENSTTPLCSGELLAGTAAFEQLAEAGISLLHYDIGWAGGVSGALEVAISVAGTDRLMTFHDCSGPISWASSLHVARCIPETAHVECVRAYAHGLYPSIASGVPMILNGVAVPLGPGHGCDLTTSFVAGCLRRISGT